VAVVTPLSAHATVASLEPSPKAEVVKAAIHEVQNGLDGWKKDHPAFEIPSLSAFAEEVKKRMEWIRIPTVNRQSERRIPANAFALRSYEVGSSAATFSPSSLYLQASTLSSDSNAMARPTWVWAVPAHSQELRRNQLMTCSSGVSIEG